MKVRALNIHLFAANGRFSLYYQPFFSLSSYDLIIPTPSDLRSGWGCTFVIH